MKNTWRVKIYDSGKLFTTELFETKGKASAYAMRWNNGRNLKYRAEMEKCDQFGYPVIKPVNLGRIVCDNSDGGEFSLPEIGE